jgi:hypothetical protein
MSKSDPTNHSSDAMASQSESVKKVLDTERRFIDVLVCRLWEQAGEEPRQDRPRPCHPPRAGSGLRSGRARVPGSGRGKGNARRKAL